MQSQNLEAVDRLRQDLQAFLRQLMGIEMYGSNLEELFEFFDVSVCVSCVVSCVVWGRRGHRVW